MSVYGIVAQSVQPNPKCESCLNYDPQRGRTGVCEVGLKPVNCGDGDMPTMGYSPYLAATPTALLGHAANGGAPDQGGREMNIIAMRVLSLGEEHTAMVKSEYQHLREVNKCNFCAQKAHSIPNAAALVDKCMCPPIRFGMLKKGFSAQLNNRQRAMLGTEEVSDEILDVFVREAVQGKGIGEIRKSINDAVISKGYYGDDWLTQFKGTDLFDDAHKLCEEELNLQEQELKTRIERAKKERERSAMMDKLYPKETWDYSATYAAQDALRIKKQKLVLKLAKQAVKAAGKQ